MSYLINNVQCDAFAHIDKRTVSDTVKLSLSNGKYHIIAFLFCDNKPYPISKNINAECCIKSSVGKAMSNCSIGTSGEIIIPIPIEFLVPDERLSCEINISGVEKSMDYRFKAASFLVAVIK